MLGLEECNESLQTFRRSVRMAKIAEFAYRQPLALPSIRQNYLVPLVGVSDSNVRPTIYHVLVQPVYNVAISRNTIRMDVKYSLLHVSITIFSLGCHAIWPLRPLILNQFLDQTSASRTGMAAVNQGSETCVDVLYSCNIPYFGRFGSVSQRPICPGTSTNLSGLHTVKTRVTINFLMRTKC